LRWSAWSSWHEYGWVESSLEEVLQSLGFLSGSIVVGSLEAIVGAELSVVVVVDVGDKGESIKQNTGIMGDGLCVRPLTRAVWIVESFSNRSWNPVIWCVLIGIIECKGGSNKTYTTCHSSGWVDENSISSGISTSEEFGIIGGTDNTIGSKSSDIDPFNVLELEGGILQSCDSESRTISLIIGSELPGAFSCSVKSVCGREDNFCSCFNESVFPGTAPDSTVSEGSCSSRVVE